METREHPTDILSLLAGMGLAGLYTGPAVTTPDAGPVRGIDAVLADEEKPPPQWTFVTRDVDPPTEERTKSAPDASSPDEPPAQVHVETPLDGQQLLVGLGAEPFGDPFADPLGKADPDESLPDSGSGSRSDMPSPITGSASDSGSSGASDDASGASGGPGAARDGHADIPTLDSPMPPSSGTPGFSPQNPDSAPPVPDAAPPPGPAASGPNAGPLTPRPMRYDLAGNFAKSAVYFEANRGQTAPAAKYVARGAGYNMFVTGNSAVFTFAQRATTPARSRVLDVVAMNFAGASAAAQVRGLDELTSRSNYFLGRGQNPVVNVPHYSQVQVAGLYSGIDLNYHGSADGKLEYDFVVAPGASPLAIQIQFQGSSLLALDAPGNLLINMPSGGRVVHHKPVLYQVINGARQEVTGSYALLGPDRIGFLPGPYNTALPLVIDPTLDYSTYLGGAGDDEGFAIAVDGSGSAYVAGKTLSLNFPVLSPFQGTLGGNSDAFISRLHPRGDALIYSTYLGHTGDDWANGIAVDAASNAYVTGGFTTGNFPTTPGAFQESGSNAAWVSKLGSSGF